ncbi:LytTR family transcriptional regulator [Leuconostoc falkenbergense]|jgi:two-component system, LytTR family, response regulator LytT|uniref:LytTR family DNA-binding domain-containing protein n=1 Tax=Leuconostoc falkenbergense TaxID=2766470 RepID=A0ABT7S1N7_9LACO|nr:MULTISPECIES: LytTR family DNA-binding domain-containing protein [Leuconostoc]RDG19060.1 LytTR family transcriptional regulator [Leuconostoc pseudomesenteroides]MCT4389297.1 LytTR family transcriptional regulator [Leuconostoc falkenbergense]MDM7647480.1 LytTR family DNA-binding domain-containing protein [Leuconostoc falkenbergense]MDV3544796.1 LytTR family DNA-binding domain-containing protein [Leuconostoc falkenbergense]MDV8951453.1 LytTR family transcriptional regulator [Leuconostoc falke
MKIVFQISTEVPDEQPMVIVRAKENSLETQRLMAYIRQYQSETANLVTVKAEDEIIVLKVETIILLDVVDDELLIYTTERLVCTKERLVHFCQRIKNQYFVQISKHAVININHLQSLSESFAGNMTAHLTQDNQSVVSRRYVKDLIARLSV